MAQNYFRTVLILNGMLLNGDICVRLQTHPGGRAVQGYVLYGSDQRAHASMRVRAIGFFVSDVTATG